jgi:hypothetical protein
MSSSHFGKKQTTLLVAVVFYKETTVIDGVEETRLVKKYYDFVSEYLGHNNVFYNKCMVILLDQLKTDIPFKFNKIYNVTDGGSHFASRYAFWDLGRTSRLYSNLSFILFFYSDCLSSSVSFLEIKIHQVTCPPQHGKGECDGHGAVIKRKARLYLLVGMYFCSFLDFVLFLKIIPSPPKLNNTLTTPMS